MVSQNPDELRRELEDTEFDGDEGTLTLLRSETERTVGKQLEIMGDIDTKASQILRLNVVLIGVIVSAMSIASRYGDATTAGHPPIGRFHNLYMELGVVALVLSTALAAMTYTATEHDVGVSSENARSLLAASTPIEEVHELVVKNYIVRINFNRSANVRNVPLSTATIVFTVVAVISFSLGVYRATISAIPWWLDLGALGLVAIVVYASELVEQTVLAALDIREWR